MKPSEYPVWLDGEIRPAEQSTTPLMSPSLNYGWGVYEGIRFYPSHAPDRSGPLGFRVPEHLRRLLRSAAALEMQVPYSEDELLEACAGLVRHSGLASGYLRPLVVLRAGAMSVAAQLHDVQVAVGCWPWSGYLPDDAGGIRVRTSTWTRTGASQIPPSVKSTGGYINPSLARLEATRAGDHEAVLLNAQGRVAEASAANVFAVLDGVLTTPPLSEGILPGITRDAVLTLAPELGIPVDERPLEPGELGIASELVLAGTAMEVVKVGVLDSRPVGDAGHTPVFDRLRSAFDDAIHGRCAGHEDWNTDFSSRPSHGTVP